MPHFSPINWLIAGFIFYLGFVLFINLLWWTQNFTFSSDLNLSSFKFMNSWNWF